MKYVISIILIFAMSYQTSGNTLRHGISTTYMQSVVQLGDKYVSFNNLDRYHGGGFGYVLRVPFHENFVFNFNLKYLFKNYNFDTPCHCPTPYVDRLGNEVTSHIIEIPLKINIRHSNFEKFKTYFSAGIGAAFNVYNYREIYSYAQKPIGEPPENIHEGPFSLPTELSEFMGSFYQFGVGHHFDISNISFAVEVKYRNNIFAWQYETLPEEGGTIPLTRRSWMMTVLAFPFQ